MKNYIKIYCIIASIILSCPPVYQLLPRGVIARATFPNNHHFIFKIIGLRFIEIDWSLLLLELLLLAFILGFIYTTEMETKEINEKDL